jgi:hypothetical protein
MSTSVQIGLSGTLLMQGLRRSKVDDSRRPVLMERHCRVPGPQAS